VLKSKDSNQANFSWHEYGSQDKLADALADHVACQINLRINLVGRAVIALSGGSTPKLFFKQLATREVDWAKVFVTLVDERWVDESHALSNAAFLKEHFLSLLETPATYIPLYLPAESVEASLDPVLQNYCELTQSALSEPSEFDVVVLGMGEDGHTASFFPDAANIAELVDCDSPSALLSCQSASSQVARVTWSLPKLIRAQLLILHITGVAKKAVFKQAEQSSDALELPIRSVMFQDRAPVQVYYAD
jgi:6-phosphogluconolactonase